MLEVSGKRVLIVLVELVFKGGAALLSGIYFQEEGDGQSVDADFTICIGPEL